MRTSVEIFMNRMKSDQMRGRSIANDSTVQTLFQSINNTHPMLIQFMNELEEKRCKQARDELLIVFNFSVKQTAVKKDYKSSNVLIILCYKNSHLMSRKQTNCIKTE